mgnify:FL=1
MKKSWLELLDVSVKAGARVFQLCPQSERVLLWIPRREFVAMTGVLQATQMLKKEICEASNEAADQ